MCEEQTFHLENISYLIFRVLLVSIHFIYNMKDPKDGIRMP